MSKKWYASKTLWLNLVSLIVFAIGNKTGYIASPELQVEVLGLINIALRFITKEKIEW